jgi:uncharacterized alkaline shock family protein YloU
MSYQPDVPAARKPQGSAARPATERVVGEAVIAAIAAHAAVRTEGVVRLAPGLFRLPTAGVDVHYEGDIPVIHLDLVISGERPVAEVGAAVRRAVTDAVTADADVAEPVITVSVSDIELGAGDRVWR